MFAIFNFGRKKFFDFRTAKPSFVRSSSAPVFQVPNELYEKANAALAKELSSKADTQTLQLLKKVMREDMRAVSSVNPIAKEVIRRYLDIIELTGIDGEQLRSFDSSPVFLEQVQALTFSHNHYLNFEKNINNTTRRMIRRHD